MAIIKLEKGGPGVSFIARSMTPDVSTQGKEPVDQWRLVGQTPTDDKAALWIAQDTLARQLKRLGIPDDQFIGTVLVYSRTEKNYVDVNFPVEPFPGTGGAPMQSVPMTDDERGRVIAAEKDWYAYAFPIAREILAAQYGAEWATIPDAQRRMMIVTAAGSLYQGLSARGVSR